MKIFMSLAVVVIISAMSPAFSAAAASAAAAAAAEPASVASTKPIITPLFGKRHELLAPTPPPTEGYTLEYVVKELAKITLQQQIYQQRAQAIWELIALNLESPLAKMLEITLDKDAVISDLVENFEHYQKLEQKMIAKVTAVAANIVNVQGKSMTTEALDKFQIQMMVPTLTYNFPFYISNLYMNEVFLF